MFPENLSSSAFFPAESRAPKNKLNFDKSGTIVHASCGSFRNLQKKRKDRGEKEDVLHLILLHAAIPCILRPGKQLNIKYIFPLYVYSSCADTMF